jgi:hypothetical protein
VIEAKYRSYIRARERDVTERTANTNLYIILHVTDANGKTRTVGRSVGRFRDDAGGFAVILIGSASISTEMY